MADIRKTVEIIFGGKNELTGVITDVSRQFSTLGGMADTVTQPLARIGDSVLKTDAALAALAIGGMALAVKESSNFNSSFGLISTSIDATGADLAKYREDILAYSTTSSRSLEDINAALYTAAQAGVKWGDSLQFIGKAEELAVANKANLNTTVDLLTGTMNAYGFTLKDVAHINDVFFTSTLIGKQTIDELGTSMGSVVAIAANSGVSFEELSAAISTLTAKGMKTEDAITAVKNVITTIVSPSREAATAAEKLGLTFSLTELNSKGFAAMLSEIMAKTGGSKEKMVELFNEVRAMNGALQLTGDGMKFFNGAVEQIGNSAGKSAEAYAKMAATFEAQSQGVINAAKGVLISLGTELEPIAAKVAGSFGALFAGIKVGVDSGAFDPLFAYLDQVGTRVAEWIKAVAAAFPDALAKLDYSSLIAAIEDLGRAFGDYLGNLDLTKSDDLAAALQTVVDIITGLIRVTSGMVDAFRPFATAIADFLRSVADSGVETQETMGKVLAFAQAIQGAGLAVVAAIMAIDEFGISMRGMFEILAGGTQFVWNGIQIVIKAIMDWLLMIEGAIVQTINTLTLGLFPGIGALQAQIGQQVSAVTKSILTDADEAKAGLVRMADGFVTLGRETGTSRDRVAELRQRLLEVPTETKTEVKIHNFTESQAQVEKITTALVTLPDTRDIGIVVQADGTAIEKANNVITKWFPDGRVLITNVGTEADEAGLRRTQAAIDTAIPKEKQVEIQAKLDVEKIKAAADVIQTSIQWKAKLDIAEVEANAKIIQAAFKSIDNTISSTGTTLSSILGSYAQLQGSGKGGTSFIEQQVAEESRRRDEALVLQKALTEAEIENMKARTEAMKSGNALITINGAGLQPQLEAFMFEILKAIQVRANAEGMKFLVGV